MTPTVQRRARALVGCTAVAALATVGLATSPAAADAAADGHAFVSEIHYDNAGTDVGEAVEVQAPLGTDLTGWSVVLYNGANGLSYGTRSLTGLVPAPADDPSGDGVVVLEYPVNGIQNGSPDGLALVDGTGTVVEFLSYEGTFAAANGPAQGTTSTDIGIAQNGTEPVGASLQLVEGTWQASDYNTFGQVNDTVGLGTAPPPPGPAITCDDEPTHLVGEVQGSGAATPLAGQTVVVEGVVTADTPDLDGFFVQGEPDGDPATSDGVFVFAPGADVDRGDVVLASGTAEEFFTNTQVSAGTDVVVCGTGAQPAAAVLPMPSDSATRERYEGMLVTVEEQLTVTGLFGLEQFGEVRVSVGGILEEPTEVAEPGPEANAVAAENVRREITIDDGSGRNLVSAGIAPPYLTPTDTLRIGDDVAELGEHVLQFSFSQWRLQPVTGQADQVTFDDTNPRTAAPEVGGDVTVAAYNVLNYFVTLTSENSNARGAATEEAFLVQQSKIVAGITALDADVVALQEIENGAPLGGEADQALAALVDALNAEEGAGTWDFVPTPEYGRTSPDVIQNAIIYRTGSVERVGDALAGGVGADPTIWDNAREPVAQLFEAADGDRFWVVSNHFKSKGAGGATGANLDQGDGQGAFNADRTLQAQDLARFATEELEPVDADVFLMGDFNAYGNEDPITTLEAAGYVDVVDGLDYFTYSFNQRNGNLDHAMVSAAAAAKVAGADIWQVNAQEPFAYQYDSGQTALIDPDSPFRASDHNAILVGFDTLGTDTSLADVLAGVSGPFDRDGSDYDVLAALVADVLEANPDSPVGVLADPTVPLTAFLPNDEAFRATAEEILPGRVPQERVAYNRLLDTLGVDGVEEVLLGHVVLGQTLESPEVLAADGESFTTAAGTTLTVDVRDDGSVAIVDERAGNRDALLVLDAIDLNLGQVQVGHTVDRVLLGG